MRRSLCVICGPITRATRGAVPSGMTGIRIPRMGGEPIGFIPCKACNGLGVVVLK